MCWFKHVKVLHAQGGQKKKKRVKKERKQEIGGVRVGGEKGGGKVELSSFYYVTKRCLVEEIGV